MISYSATTCWWHPSSKRAKPLEPSPPPTPRPPTTGAASTGLQELLDIDEIQARAILDMQLRRLAALERQKIIDRLEELERLIADYKAILASEDRQREIISTELAEIVDKYGDERRTRIIAADGDFSEEDFIPDDDVVVTITRGGYAKRTAVSEYRQQGRGGVGIKAMALSEERGSLVGGLVVSEADEIIAIKTSGQITRSAVSEVPAKGRSTMGVKFVSVRGGDAVSIIAVNPEHTVEEGGADE